MGDIAVGDLVIAEDGTPTRVSAGREAGLPGGHERRRQHGDLR
jgi:hypothetical protein